MALNRLRKFVVEGSVVSVNLTLLNANRNAVSLRNLVRLASLLETPAYFNKAQETVRAFRLSLSKFPFAIPALVASFMLVSNGQKEASVCERWV